MSKEGKLKFYGYSQNNSGGSFEINENVKYYVCIEAHSPCEANDRAEDIGIYFDGVEYGLDCECCGDRWNKVIEGDGANNLNIYGASEENGDCNDESFTPTTEENADCVVHRYNGDVEYYVWNYIGSN